MDPKTRLRRAARRYREAKAEREAAIRAAAEQGLTRRAIAQEVDISFGRVQQIIKEKEAEHAS